MCMCSLEVAILVRDTRNVCVFWWGGGGGGGGVLIGVRYLGQVLADKGGILLCRPLKVKVLTQLFGIKGHADRHSAWFDSTPQEIH